MVTFCGNPSGLNYKTLALSHVSPDAVFSSINGHESNPNALSDEEDEEGIENAQANPSETTPKAEKAKKQSKSTLDISEIFHSLLIKDSVGH